MAKKYGKTSYWRDYKGENPDMEEPADKLDQAERKLSGECVWCGVENGVPIGDHHMDCIARLKNMAGIK